jgi:hypothetical protein
MWDFNRPIYNKLPVASENWQGNELVDWLTGFWDDLLVKHKENLSDPVDWLGEPDSIDPIYLDWVGIGLCGYGNVWDKDWGTEIKREMIRNFPDIMRFRGSLNSCQKLVESVDSNVTVLSYSGQARAGIDLAGVAVCGGYDPTHYSIIVPPNLPRNGRVWYWLERLKIGFFPMGAITSRVQHPSLAGYSLAGDSTTGLTTYNYAELP